MKLAIALFAKWPEAGRTKTRLIPALGEQGAADFARYLLLSRLQNVQRWSNLMFKGSQPNRAVDVSVTVWTDGGSPEHWQALLGPQVSIAVQVPGHLGQRMGAAVQHHLKHTDAVLLLGTDAVCFSASHLQAMLDQLHGDVPVVFAPAHDGGYVAALCAGHVPAMFGGNIDWGTASVLSTSLRLLKEAGYAAPCIEAQLDVDEPADLQQALDEGWVPGDWATLFDERGDRGQYDVSDD